MTLRRGLVIGLLLVPLLAWGQEPDLQRQHQFEMAQKLLERTTQDHEQCKRDWADIWVQARQLSMAYQKLHQEMQALKEAKGKDEIPAVPQDPAPPGNGGTP
jgi:hypothetical protein